MNQEHRIRLLKWLDKATPDQLKEFDKQMDRCSNQKV